MHNDCEILIADRHPLLRLGIKELLISTFSKKNIQCKVHEAGDYQSAINRAKQHIPDIAIIDSSFPDDNGADLMEVLRTIKQDMLILVFSIKDEKLHAERAIRSGAKGYIMKDAEPEELIRALERVCNGNIWLSEQMKDELCSTIVAKHKPVLVDSKVAISSLSNRELQIFKLIGEGLTRSEIAQRTNISIYTVETHRSNIKQKFGVKTSDEIRRVAFLALHNGNL